MLPNPSTTSNRFQPNKILIRNPKPEPNNRTTENSPIENPRQNRGPHFSFIILCRRRFQQMHAQNHRSLKTRSQHTDPRYRVIEKSDYSRSYLKCYIKRTKK
jgi:hypothetical protein